MAAAALLLLGASLARAQPANVTPEPAAPAVSTAAAPAPAPAPEAEPGEIKGKGLKRGTGKVAPAAVKKTAVKIHADAKDWEPVSLVRSGVAAQAKTFFERRIRKVRGAYKGQGAAAKATARIHKFKGDSMLVVSVYPASLRYRRTHLEARFLIQEGFLEGVTVAAVTVPGGAWEAADDKEDSFSLRAKGVEFQEESPGSAAARLSAVTADAGASQNAGSVRLAAFGDPELGFVSFGWSVNQVEKGR